MLCGRQNWYYGSVGCGWSSLALLMLLCCEIINVLEYVS